jgi:serine/threonine protein kinase
LRFASIQVVEDVRNEADILQTLRHPNVVLYMGICLSPQVCIVTEYVVRGSLFDILYDHAIVINFEVG